MLYNAAVGFIASVVADMLCNPIRVIKTLKQLTGSERSRMSYMDAARIVIRQDGVQGLFCRGLTTRLVSNGFQSMVFTVVWRYLSESSLFST